MFCLPRTAATIVSVTNRSEKHGEDDVPAVTVGVKITGPNTILDRLSPTLRTTLYEQTPGQPEPLPGVERTTPKLRTVGIEYVAGSGVLEGWTCLVEHGIDDESAVVLKACKLDKWRVVPKEGGEVDFSFRIGTANVDPRIMGLLAFKVGQEVRLEIEPPQVLGDATMEKAAQQAAKKQKKAEAAGQQRIDAPPQRTPEQALAESVRDQS